MTLDNYRYEVSKQMLTVYGIDWDDAGGGNEPLQSTIEDGWSAEEFVDWFGRKYDLDPLCVFGLKPPYKRIAQLKRKRRGSSLD
jgi:hypothetical protein